MVNENPFDAVRMPKDLSSAVAKLQEIPPEQVEALLKEMDKAIAKSPDTALKNAFDALRGLVKVIL